MPSEEAGATVRYTIHDAIATGGMATIHFGRILADGGFSRVVAVKRLHPHFTADPELVAMLVDEARIASRIQHPNVVPVIDVVTEDRELLLVMEYVTGESLARLVRAERARGSTIAPAIAVAILAGTLRGLHAAHETNDEAGNALGIVHRDVSPENILVSSDGLARVLDFGVAKARGRLQKTTPGIIKGKIAYMAPEQLRAEAVDRRSDVYAAGVVLWETLSGERLYASAHGALVDRILKDEPPLLTSLGIGIDGIDEVIRRALAKDRERRYATALEMLADLERVVAPATQTEVAGWLDTVAGEIFAARARAIEAIERRSAGAREPEQLGRGDGPAGVVRTKVVRRRGRAGHHGGAGSPTPGPKSTRIHDLEKDELATKREPRRTSPTPRAGSHPSDLPPAREPRAARPSWSLVMLALVTGAAMASAIILLLGRDAPAPAPSSASLVVPASSGAEPQAAHADEPPNELPAPPSTPRRRSLHGRTPAPRSSASPKSCDPPYYWDPDGKKRFRPECVR